MEQSVKIFLEELPAERQNSMWSLYETISENLPVGFQEEMSSGMISWAVPLVTYTPGYHCSPNTPLPFLSLASQKNFIALYHLGIYGNADLHDWFVREFPKHSTRKPDMGKSCIRFKNPDDLPFQLIADLCQKITPAEWIATCEKLYKK